MAAFITLFLFFVQFLCFQLSFSGVLSPVKHDHITRRFELTVHMKSPLQPTNLLLDLSAPLSWIDCTANDTSIPCNSLLCNTLTTTTSCSDGCSRPAAGPSCANASCHVILASPRRRRGVMVKALVEKLGLPATDGRNPGQIRVIPEFVLSCSKRSAVRGIVPKRVTGLAALGRSNFSLPAQFGAGSGSPNVFALCLSSSPSAPGVAFFGSPGPYNFFPEGDLSRHLNYTPLLPNPRNPTHKPSTEYFIGLNSIKVNGKTVVQLNRSRAGFGVAKFSLGAPYTVVESSIYKLLTEAFVNETNALKFTVTEPVKPFTVCYDEADVWHTKTGPAAPVIDLVTHGEEKLWRIFGHNSMVRIPRSREGLELWCLGFVDGGVKPRWPVVIGWHQMVDNLLQFDLESERLGFTSSVMVHNTMCANFNFTVNSGLTQSLVK
ncbi:OLC1v1007370C1 [Oldenlandia corymbosa var. corymbosa]|uniref:OLC1v1007370C1 n=1 Tax=Oldenlandia corymbosa var. corymbosa TaxID=529605 RepID=A0AAV1DJ41_OLDCO|nr:OLC1v1007370C1 [Oldenlandia corymbosa var. corymbosa]